MNTRLLCLARRYKGARRWSVPGYGNGIALIPSRDTGKGWGAKVSWPFHDAKGEAIRGVDLDRHRKLALQEIRALLESVT
jgi:hypothetical protein